MSYVGISTIAYQKLATLRRDLLAMTDAERLEFTRTLRAKRIKPPQKEKPAKVVAEKKPRKKKGEPVAP